MAVLMAEWDSFCRLKLLPFGTHVVTMILFHKSVLCVFCASVFALWDTHNTPRFGKESSLEQSEAAF